MSGEKKKLEQSNTAKKRDSLNSGPTGAGGQPICHSCGD